VTPFSVGSTVQLLWETDLPATTTSAGIIVMIPRDQLNSVTASGDGDIVTIEDGFTSLSSILVFGASNIIEAVTSSTTQLLTYTDGGLSTSAIIEAIDVGLLITGTSNNVKVKGTVSNVRLTGVSAAVLVEGDVTNIVADGVSNALSINGNGCDGFPAGTGVENTCSSSTTTVMVTRTQACTSSTQNSVCTSEFSSSGSSITKSCSILFESAS
jgi:hypothetical protein